MGRNKNLAKSNVFSKSSKIVISELLNELLNPLLGIKGNIDDNGYHILPENLIANLHNLCSEKVDGHFQLSVLKQMSNHLKSNRIPFSNHGINSIAKLLSIIFIHTKPKHPARKTVASILESLSVAYHEEIITSLRAYVLEFLKSCTNIDGIDIEIKEYAYQIRLKAELISALLDDFTAQGLVVVKGHLIQMLEILTDGIELLTDLARHCKVREEQGVIMMDCLFQFKTCVLLLNHATTDCMAMQNNTNNLTVYRNLINLAASVTQDEEFLLDCRIASSIIVPSILQQILSPMECLQVYCILMGELSSTANDVEPCANQEFLTCVVNQLSQKSASTLTRLSILHGILVKADKSILHFEIRDSDIGTPSNGYSLFNTHVIQNVLEICKIVTDKSSVVSAFRNLACWSNEAFNFCKEKQNTDTLQVYSLEGTLMPSVLDILVSFLGHPIDAVRHQIKAALKSLFSILSLAPNAREAFCDLFCKFYVGGLHHRENFLLLICLVSEVNVCDLPMYKRLPRELLDHLNNIELNTYACQLYVQIAIKDHTSYKEKDIKGWLQHWMQPLFHLFNDDNELIKLSIANSLLPQLVSSSNDSSLLFEHWLMEYCNASYLGIIPVMLKIFKSIESKRQSALCNTSWMHLVDKKIIKACLGHLDDQIRLETFSLLCESHKTTDCISKSELQLIKFFLEYNMNNQSPRFRQQLHSNFKTLISRVRDRIRRLVNQLAKVGECDSKEDVDEYHEYEYFLEWLLSTLFSSLQHTSSFPRLNTTLLLLGNLATLASELNGLGDVAKTVLCIENFYNEQNIGSLVFCLFSNYEAVKSMAGSILCQVPVQCWRRSLKIRKFLCSDCLRLISSPIPDEAATGSHMLMVIVKGDIINDEEAFQLLANNVVKDSHTFFSAGSSFKAGLSLLLRVLQKEFSVARSSLLLAARKAPMHGILQSIRFMMEDLSRFHFDSSGELNSLIQQLLECVFQIFDLVSPAVSALAPEGYVSEELDDHNILVEEILKELSIKENNASEVEVQSHKSQMLLVCCWRTMKEVCLLLGDLCYRNLKMMTFSFLSFEIVVNIGDLFLNILSSSRHIGAFELAYTGFIKICEGLWKSKEKRYASLPSTWIDALLHDLLSGSGSNVLCMTRRSAGLPFYVQAICISEPDVNNFWTMKKVLKDLLSFCMDADISEKNLVSRKVICLNIIRALFRETKLGDNVFTFVSDGFKIAIHGSKSSYWAVRNSCSLLYSALMTRVFGVKKTRKTGKEFFSRFPEMYNLLINELESILATDKSVYSERSVQLYPTTYPVLLLISHLYPSTIDGRDSRLCLSTFVPYVMQCGISPISKTRSIAARALASLVTPDILENVIQEILSSIQEMIKNKKIRQNELHGKLLQVSPLLSEAGKSSFHDHVYKKAYLNVIQCSWILSSGGSSIWAGGAQYDFHENRCCVTKHLYLDIVSRFIFDKELVDSCATQDILSDFMELFVHTLCTPIRENGINTVPHSLGIDPYIASCTRALLKYIHFSEGLDRGLKTPFQHRIIADCLTSCKENSKQDLKRAVLTKLITSDMVAVRKNALKYLRENPDLLKGKFIQELLMERISMDLEDDRECHYEMSHIVSTIKDVWKSYEGKPYWNCLKIWAQMNKNMERYGDSDSLIISYLKISGHIVHWLLDMKGQQVHVEYCDKTLLEIAYFIKSSIDPDRAWTRREAVALMYKDSLLKSTLERFEIFEGKTIELLWLVAFSLLQDEDQSVRNAIATAVYQGLKNKAVSEDHALFFDIHEDYCVEPNLATDILLETFGTLFCNRSPTFWFHMLIFLSIGDDLISQQAGVVDGNSHECILNFERLFVDNKLNTADCKDENITLFETEERNSFAESFRFRSRALRSFISHLSNTVDPALRARFKELTTTFLEPSDLRNVIHEGLRNWALAQSSLSTVRRSRSLTDLYLVLLVAKELFQFIGNELDQVLSGQFAELLLVLENSLAMLGIQVTPQDEKKSSSASYVAINKQL